MVTLLEKHRRWLVPAMASACLALGFVALHLLTSEVHFKALRAGLDAIAPARLALAVALTAASYLALTFYDVLALRVIGKPLPWRTAALASFTSYTLSHNLGLSPLTGGSARYRVYSSAALDGPDIARIVAIASATFWMGVLAMAGVALLLHGGAFGLGAMALSAREAHGLGAAVLAALAGLLALSIRGPATIGIGRWSLPVPRPLQLLAQIGIAGIDLAAASAALFVLLPGADPALLPTFMLAYATAIIVALVSHVPGGVGVFETVILAIVPGDRAALFAALVAYRAIYYLLPLALGIVVMVVREGAYWRRPAARALAGARLVAGGVAPLLMSAATFVGGAILLLSGSVPAIPERLRALHAFVPLPFIEASHVAASLVGTALLLLAPGLYRRLDGAFFATRALLLAGAAFSIAKGFDWEEATICLSIAGLLQWTKPAFYRRTALTAQPLSPVWFVCVTAVLGLSIWAGLFAFKQLDYRNDLWWQFSLHGGASRFLRATLAAAVMLGATAIWRLLAPARAAIAETVDSEVMARILRTADRTDANLALTGDKRFLVSRAEDAVLMYQVKGSSWIVMGDPAGNPDAWPELLWEIRAMADAAQGRLLLYQISSGTLEISIEMGLQIVKYGEEAIVRLADFTLDGGRMRSLRQTGKRLAREGVTFAIVPSADVRSLLPELEVVSAEWLAAKGQREKGFSLGRFDADYLARFDCAVARAGGRIVAFANIWKTENRRELSIDLMRHADDAPSGVMDFLFVNLMLWGKAERYRDFTLGLAPLSGIASRPLAPIWAKAAALLFNHGERFYGFRGLRAYKEKFSPVWEPRYVAGPHGIAMVRALGDLNALIGRVGGEKTRPRPPRDVTTPAATALGVRRLADV